MADVSAVVSEGGVGWGAGYCESFVNGDSNGLGGRVLLMFCAVQVKEELENDAAFFDDFAAAPKGKGGMAAPEAQAQPAAAST